MRSTLSLSLDDAVSVLAAAIKAAEPKAVSVAVTDASGALLAFQRMDQARAYTADLAIQKARTSALVGVPTAAIQAAGKDISAGGLPIIVDNQCVGAVGVSGGPTEEDVRIASAGAATIRGDG